MKTVTQGRWLTAIKKALGKIPKGKVTTFQTGGGDAQTAGTFRFKDGQVIEVAVYGKHPELGWDVMSPYLPVGGTFKLTTDPNEQSTDEYKIVYVEPKEPRVKTTKKVVAKYPINLVSALIGKDKFDNRGAKQILNYKTLQDSKIIYDRLNSLWNQSYDRVVLINEIKKFLVEYAQWQHKDLSITEKDVMLRLPTWSSRGFRQVDDTFSNRPMDTLIDIPLSDVPSTREEWQKVFDYLVKNKRKTEKRAKLYSLWRSFFYSDSNFKTDPKPLIGDVSSMDLIGRFIEYSSLRYKDSLKKYGALPTKKKLSEMYKTTFREPTIETLPKPESQGKTMSKSTDVLILAFNKDIATEIGEKILGLEQKNFFQPSEHQAQLINFVNSGSGNGLVQAVAGAGKTTTILQSINELRKTYQSGRMTKNGRTLRWGDGFSITSSTQHALALKVLSSHYPELKTREGFRAKIDEGKVTKIVQQMFLKNGAWFKNNSHEIISNAAMVSNLKRRYRSEDEEKQSNFEKRLQKWERKAVGKRGAKPKLKELPSDVAYEKLMEKQKKTLTDLINGMVNAGVGLLEHYPLTMETTRKLYTLLSVEPQFIQGAYYEDEEGILHPTYKLWTVNSDGDRIPPSFGTDYSFIQKDKICYLALEVMKQLHNESIATSTIDFNLMIYKAVQNQSGKLSYPKYNFVFQDECQDTNQVTMELLARLVKLDGDKIVGRIIGVGDVAQAIYGFRGADSYAMSTFQQKFNCTTLPLTTCYRCAKSILSDVRKLGDMYSSIQPTSDAALGLCQYSPSEIGDFLSPEINEQVKEGGKYKVIKRLNPNYLSPAFFNSDTAFIARSKSALENFAQLMLVNGIPFNFVGYLVNDELDPDEDDVPQIPMVEGADPEGGLENLILYKIVKILDTLSKGFYAFRKRNSFSLKNPQKDTRWESVNSFMYTYKSWLKNLIYQYKIGKFDNYNFIDKSIKDYEIIYQVMEGVMNRYGHNPFIIDKNYMVQLTNVKQYLRDIYGSSDLANAITIVTAHKSKGLEFPRVILDITTFNRFDPPRDANMAADEIQEMNMLYVAMTRAEKELLILTPDVEPDEDEDRERDAVRFEDRIRTFAYYDPNFKPKLKANSERAYKFVPEFEDTAMLVEFFGTGKGSRLGYFATVNNEQTDSRSPYKIILDNDEFDLDRDDLISIRLFDSKGGVFLEKVDEDTLIDPNKMQLIVDSIIDKLNSYIRRR